MFKRVLTILIFILFLAGLVNAQEVATVKRITDGNTLVLSNDERVRLIGIDAPESRPNARAKKQAGAEGKDEKTILQMGKESTKFVKTLVKPGDEVKLEFDVEKRDRYGRLLAYIYLADGRMLNEEIVKEGYANILTVPPNVKYQERFLKAYRESRHNKRGLWK